MSVTVKTSTVDVMEVLLSRGCKIIVEQGKTMSKIKFYFMDTLLFSFYAACESMEKLKQKLPDIIKRETEYINKSVTEAVKELIITGL